MSEVVIILLNPSFISNLDFPSYLQQIIISFSKVEFNIFPGFNMFLNDTILCALHKMQTLFFIMTHPTPRYTFDIPNNILNYVIIDKYYGNIIK